MSASDLKNGHSLSVGAKQTKLAIEKGEAVTVYIAEDADTKLTGPIVARCHELNIPLVGVASMRELGEACGIQVGAATAARLHTEAKLHATATLRK